MLFRVYIHDLIRVVTNAPAGCTMFKQCFNLLAYADDMVLLAPSWSGMQGLINILVAAADEIGLTFNAKKTVAMIFNPTGGRKCLSIAFPNFSVGDKNLTFVTCFLVSTLWFLMLILYPVPE